MCELDKGELKKALEELGLYEDKMGIADMKQIYNTIKQSKDSATQENEYRELLSNSEANRSLLESLRSKDQITIEFIKKDSVNKVKLDNSTDNIFDELNEETIPLIEHKIDTPDSKLKQTENDFDEIKQSEETRKPRKFEFTKLKTQKLIDCSSVINNYKPLNLRVSKVKPALHPMVWNLPCEIRAQIFFKLHLYKSLKYKNYSSEFIEPIPWGEPIQARPLKKFNGNLFVDYVPDTSDEEVTEKPVCSSSSSDINSTSQRKSTRQTKRKCYIESNSSEEDDFVTGSKKTKSNNTTFNTSTEFKTTENNGKWLSKPKPESKSSLLNYATDRTKKILNNAEKVVEKSKTTKKPQETMDVTDDDDDNDTFIEIKTVVDVHNNATPKKDTKPNPANPFIKNRNSARKRDTKPNVDEDEILVDNSVSEVATHRFYNTRNHPENEDSPPPSGSEPMTECPICLCMYKLSVIENHAATCDQFSEPMTPCDYCEREFPQSELKIHKEKCFDHYISTDTNKETNTNHLCSVCDKYFNENAEFQAHVSKCIAGLSGR